MLLNKTTPRPTKLAKTDGLNGSVAVGKGLAPEGVILSLITFDVVVRIAPEMEDSNYYATAILFGSATLLNNARIQGVIERTKNSCTIRVVNISVLSAIFTGLTIEVIAVRLNTPT